MGNLIMCIGDAGLYFRGSTWSGMLGSFDRVQWLDASRRGHSSRLSRPYLGYPQQVLESGLDFRPLAGNPFGGSACDLSRLLWLRALAYKGRNRPWRFAFLPIGRVFSGRSRCGTALAQNSERPICEEEKDR